MNSSKGSVFYVAYHYPPVQGSSGVHRTVAFTRHLSEQGWDVSVLTAGLKAYENVSMEQLNFIPKKVNVIRAFARNTAKHLAIKGKYLSILALPDNFQTWIWGGVCSGLWRFFKQRPSVIVSTYPIASAHVIGYILHKLSGIPWVADLRDPMAQPGYPSDRKKFFLFNWIERNIVKHAKYAILTAPGAKAFYKEKFPDVMDEFWQVIPNGFDEVIFESVSGNLSKKPPNSKKVLLHSGIIYPSERDPTAFLKAISALKKQNLISSDLIEIRLRATGHDNKYQPLISDLGIEDIVNLAPSLDYKSALEEMLSVDGLIIMQSEGCNYQIPAKAYEYIRAMKPIFALTPEEGDTAQLLKCLGTGLVNTSLTCAVQIENDLKTFLSLLAEDAAMLTKESVEVHQYSRQYQAQIFEEVLSSAAKE